MTSSCTTCSGHDRRRPPTGSAQGVPGHGRRGGQDLPDAPEGGAEAEAGRDVVIGYLEPHGRAKTLAQAEGLEIVPRREVRYRETPMTEMNLPVILRRSPELCLIDELAHSNVPGLEHDKRHEDVADVLAAGIDVYSTVNVQHLESLNARLRAGKVYPPEQVPGALSNFFIVENLAALREVSLRQVAEGIEAKRLPAAQRGESEAEQLAALRKLTSVLGAHLLVERGEDVALVAARVARERQTTYVLMGTPGPRGVRARLTGPGLPTRLMRLLPGVDLRIVADRSQRTPSRGTGRTEEQRWSP